MTQSHPTSLPPVPAQIAEVLLDVSVRKTLDYAIPLALKDRVCVGTWVTVPLRQRTRSGCVVAIKDHSSFSSLSQIQEVISDGPVLTPDLFQLMLWMARYYACPVERVLKTMLPSGVRKGVERKKQYLVVRGKTRDELALLYRELASKAPQQANILQIMIKAKRGMLLTELLELAECQPASVKALEQKGALILESIRSNTHSLIVGEKYFKTKRKLLRPEQQKALEEISKTLTESTFATHLLWGVTGSGKTEVYMQAIEKALELGKSALLLVPEISLTGQTIQRLKSRFDVPMSVLHHRLSDGERNEAWDDIRSGTSKIVIGARSSIFSPLPKLGLIIVDEEHESSYKQTDDSPTYHARDIAVMRGYYTQATVVLGSATPSFESFHNAEKGKYNLITLLERSGSHQLPQVHILDMRRENEKVKGICLLSDALLSKIEKRLEKGEQSILFLNRRGYHTSCLCQSCYNVLKCSHCDTAMTFHKSANTLACHLCGLEVIPPRKCPSCQEESIIQYRGAGTERVEALLKAILPSARVLRADLDTTRHKGSMERILNAFRSGKADVLIGTQMITKGLHFPEVTLVGVLNCDSSLHVPDFRASETVFQLITQVAGRAGRGVERGEVILQTSLPESSVIQKAAQQDFLGFYKEESVIREMFGFPPYQHIVKFVFIGSDEIDVRKSAESFVALLQSLLPPSYSVHPALPSGHAKVKDMWRYQTLARGPKAIVITQALEQVDKKIKLPPHVRRFIDVDPQSTFF